MIKLLSWKVQKLAFRVLKGLKGETDDPTYILVECYNCGFMACLPDYGFEGTIPGIPVFNYENRNCSNCMDQEAFIALTS